jgi:tetratricopeptide (TPR) repeat protein
MKHPILAGLIGGVLFCSGCQSMNWTANDKSPADNPLAQTEKVREVPWSWGKKKPAPATPELPAEFAKKFEDAKRRSSSAKTVDEWIAEGSAQEVARNFPAAKKAYEEALALDPANAVAHHRLGILADMRQEYGTAQDHYEAALRQKPHDPNLLSDLGYSHYLRGNVQQSKRYLLQALDIDRMHRQALKNLGTLYASQGWYDDAMVAFRHYRSEAEAQQLMAQYFPNGRSATKGDIALAGAKQPASPVSSDSVTQDVLKNMSLEEITRLMELKKQEAIREREQKQLAELRPSLQASINGDEFASPHAPNSDSAFQNARPMEPSPWGQNAAVGNGTATNAADVSTTQPIPLARGTSSDNSGKNEMPFWSGAGIRQREPAPSTVAATGSNGLPPWAQDAPSADGNNGAPWWAAEDSAPRNVNPGGPNANLAYNNPRPNAIAANAPSATNGSVDNASRGPASSWRRQAYQLGMSVGPGTMFPVVPSAAVNSSPAASDASASVWSSATTPGGYMEMKPPTDSWPTAPANPPISQWQNAPVEVAPQSPTENWNSPTTVPWPGNAATSSGSTDRTARGNADLPVITPGVSPWGGSGRPADSSDANPEDVNGGAGQGVVPAWFNPPRKPSAPPSGGRPSPGARPSQGSNVPAWPYAPR